MKRLRTIRYCYLLALFAPGIVAAPQDLAQDASQDRAALLKAVDQLVEQNRQLASQNEKLMEQIDILRQKLAVAPTPVTQKTAPQVPPQPQAGTTPREDTEPLKNEVGPKKTAWGSYTPNLGFKVASTEHGDLNISIYTYARYLNQLDLAPTYTDSFGNVKNVQRRQDFQLNKLQIKFLGWMMSPKFRYFLYAWTSNASQGQGAQVVLAGNMTYEFNKYLTLGLGITSLPGTRSLEGNFPFWLSVDSRLMADEFFRPSYTSGIFARGDITNRLKYQAMLGNNLSTLGVSAGQLDNHFNTFSSALIWTPVGDDYGIGYGDFEDHHKLATRLATHFTRSTEDRQSQPNTEGIENTQLRLSDGSVIFTPNLFGPGISITEAKYLMTNMDFGIKYRGFSLDGTYYWRWLNHFKGPGTAGLPVIRNNGFETQASMMLIPKTFQVYFGASKIFGGYGNPWDSRLGMNWFPWKNKVVRWNQELLYDSNSPVGYTSVPFALGGKGFIFHSTLELAF